MHIAGRSGSTFREVEKQRTAPPSRWKPCGVSTVITTVEGDYKLLQGHI